MAADSMGPHLGMSKFQRMLFARTLPALQNVEPEVAAAIAEITVVRSFKQGEYVFRQGSTATGVHFIVRGRIEIRRNGTPVRVLEARNSVGGVSALAEDDQGYDAVALEDTVTLEVATEDTQEIFEDHFEMLRSVLRGSSVELLDARRELGLGAGFEEPGEDFECPDRPLDLVERMALLRKCLTFAEGKIDALADLAKDTTEQRFAKGTVLWEAGAPSNYFLLPIKGVARGEATQPQQTFYLGAGDSLGGLDAIAEVPRWYRAVAHRDLVTLRIEIDAMFDVLEDNFDMAMSMLRAFARGRMMLYDMQAQRNSQRPQAGKPAA